MEMRFYIDEIHYQAIEHIGNVNEPRYVFGVRGIAPHFL